MEELSLYFKTDRKKLLSNLKLFKQMSSSLYKTGNIRIRVLKQGIELFGIGLIKFIEADTETLFDVYVPLRIMYDYTYSSKVEKISFSFKEGIIKCGNFTLNSPYITLSDLGRTLADDDVRYDEYTILKHYYNNDLDFIKKNKLESRLTDALKSLDESVNKSFKNFKDFKVKKDDLKIFLIDFIKTHI